MNNSVAQNDAVKAEEIALPPWKTPLSRALHRNRSLAHSRYGQLATVQPNGRPANRTVVFRGFMDAGHGLKFICDRRSEKITDLQHNPWAEFCWYFAKTREQFRLCGSMTIGSETNTSLAAARSQTWQSISTNAKVSFYWPGPGAPRAEAEAFTITQINELAPPSDFTLLVLQPDSVDHLELRGEPQHRQLYQLEQSSGEWSSAIINP